MIQNWRKHFGMQGYCMRARIGLSWFWIVRKLFIFPETSNRCRLRMMMPCSTLLFPEWNVWAKSSTKAWLYILQHFSVHLFVHEFSLSNMVIVFMLKKTNTHMCALREPKTRPKVCSHAKSFVRLYLGIVPLWVKCHHFSLASAC